MKATSVDGTHESRPRVGRCALATGSPATGNVDILRKEVRRWWRHEQNAARRRDYLAAHEYAQSHDKFAALLDAAEQGNGADQRRGCAE